MVKIAKLVFNLQAHFGTGHDILAAHQAHFADGFDFVVNRPVGQAVCIDSNVGLAQFGRPLGYRFTISDT